MNEVPHLIDLTGAPGYVQESSMVRTNFPLHIVVFVMQQIRTLDAEKSAKLLSKVSFPRIGPVALKALCQYQRTQFEVNLLGKPR